MLPLDDSFIGRAVAMVPPPTPAAVPDRLPPRRRPDRRGSDPAAWAAGSSSLQTSRRATPTTGIVCALGDWNNGWACYLLDGRPVATFNLFGTAHRFEATPVTPRRPAHARRRVRARAAGRRPGEAVVDGEAVGEGRLPVNLPFRWQIGGAGLLIGRDRGFPVCDDYEPPFPFTGTLHRIVLEIPSLEPRVPRRRGRDRAPARMRLDDWFLTTEERGNPATEIDRRRGDGKAWTEGNRVEVLVDGAEYFARLYEVLCSLEPGDWVHLTDWEGDPDELLDGPGTEVGHVLADLARRGVNVRGLLWRSHPRQAHFSEQENTKLVREVNEAGGELLLDERVRRGGSHHQKLVVIRRASGPMTTSPSSAGSTSATAAATTPATRATRRPIDLNPQYGDRPPWHDIQLELRGPAVGDLAHTFRERWEDPTPFDHRNPLRIVLRHLTRQPRRPDPLPPAATRPAPRRDRTRYRSSARIRRSGLRTRSRPRASAASGAPTARRSAAARRLVYLEDQYLWSQDVGRHARRGASP